MYETFDHTADLGLRIRAATLDGLFSEAGVALMSILIDNPAAIEEKWKREIRISGADREYLLFDWLKEVLFQFEAEHVLFGRFEVRVADDGLTAIAWGEPLDWSRHEPSHEVKAITYHGLKVEATPDGWVAEVIVDI